MHGSPTETTLLGSVLLLVAGLVVKAGRDMLHEHRARGPNGHVTPVLLAAAVADIKTEMAREIGRVEGQITDLRADIRTVDQHAHDVSKVAGAVATKMELLLAGQIVIRQRDGP